MLLADRIIFIDAEAMVVDKPQGLAVDPPRDGSLSLANHLDFLRFGFQRLPVAVHRLDRDTSGCLLLARNPKTARRFGAAFEAGEVVKTYIAVLDGVPDGDSGEIDLPLSKVSTRETGWRMVADPKGKASLSRWRTIATVDGRALVEFRPTTGRTHQLRVHAATGLGLPISGDSVYGAGQGAKQGAMMLHALSITMPRGTKEPVAARAPLPPHFIAAGFTQAMVDG